MYKRLSLAALISSALLLPACSSGGDAADNPADTLTRRQKDSIVAKLPVPGAGGVGRALDALERTNARAAQHDSVATRR